MRPAALWQARRLCYRCKLTTVVHNRHTARRCSLICRSTPRLAATLARAFGALFVRAADFRCARSGGLVGTSCKMNTVNPSGTATATVTINVALAASSSDLTVNAAVSVTPGSDGTPGNDADDVTVSVSAPQIDLSVAATGTGALNANGLLTIDAVVRNAGPDVASDVTADVILPPNYTLESSTCALPCAVGALAASQSSGFRIVVRAPTVRVSSSTPCVRSPILARAWTSWSRSTLNFRPSARRQTSS